MRSGHTSALVGLAVVLAAAPVLAEEEAAGEAHEEEHHHHENHVAIFLGATTGLGDTGTTRFTAGADYERRLSFISHIVGAGVLVDAAIGSETETLIAGFVAVHPVTGLMILGAVGAAVTGAFKDAAFGLRGGAAYFFTVGSVAIGPEVNVDYANKEIAIVAGLAVGMGF